MAETEAVLFDHVDLNLIDPSFSPIEEDMYNMRILKMEKRDFEYKTGKKTGQPGQLISIQLMVTDHPSYSGRRVFEALFPSNFTFRVLRRIADLTGIQQDPGDPIESWLEAVSMAQPSLKFKVGLKKDYDGNVIVDPVTQKPTDNAVDWRQMQPAE